MYFLVSDGRLLCTDCRRPNDYPITVDPTMLSAMRHITYSEFNNLYKFEIPEDAADRLSVLTEKYITLQTDHHFATLDFYNSML